MHNRSNQKMAHDEQIVSSIRSAQHPFRLHESAFRNSLAVYVTTAKYTPTNEDFEMFLNRMRGDLKVLIKKKVRQYGGAKFNINIPVEFINKDDIVQKPFYVNCRIEACTEANIDEVIDRQYDRLLVNFQNDKGKESGLRYNRIIEVYINFAAWTPLQGGSYKAFPKAVIKTKSVINIQNEHDEECFRWAIMRHANQVDKNQERIKDLQKILKEKPNEYNFEGISFPVKHSDFAKFEKQNSNSINVFSWQGAVNNEKGFVFPIYISSKDPLNAIDLFWYDGHYGLIKNFNRLCSGVTRHEHKTYFCKRCLSHYPSEEKLAEHLIQCSKFEYSRIEFPAEKDKFVKFTHFERCMDVPIYIVADFECLTAPFHSAERSENTKRYQQHIPSQVGMHIISHIPGLEFEPYIYTGPNAHEKFLEKLTEVKPALLQAMNKLGEHELNNTIKTLKQQMKLLLKRKQFNKYRQCKTELEELEKQRAIEIKGRKMEITTEQQQEFDKQKASLEKADASVTCHICGRGITQSNDIVRDHCHITGKYRGPAHTICNLKFTIPDFIPVVFHNLKGYDSHFIMQIANQERFGIKNITCIPLNKEKYISFSLDEYRFLDSFQFMASGLDTLTKNLKSEGIQKFKHTQKYFDNDKLDLVTKKGVCPYDYINSFEKMDETSLPPIEAFYSVMYNRPLDEKDYEHAQAVWNAFECKSMKEYLELYLKVDVLCLADVFESFRETSMKNYGLDPLHYYTAPGLGWDALFKMTAAEVELIRDPDMFMFFERGLRGGISMISNPYAKANNKYLPDYDPEKPIKYIAYLDANNLYGYAMMMYLPYANFRWWTDEDILKVTIDDIMLWKADSEIGRGFEVRISIPKELHDFLNDYPLAVDMMEIEEKMLSPYNKWLHIRNKTKHIKCAKLVPSFLLRDHYICDYRNLQLYLKLGAKLEKVYRVIEYDQKPWMRPYIEFNSKQRQKAKNEFEKDFFKLMNNAVFGKTMENVRKHINVKICKTEKQKNKLINNPRCENWTIWDENYAMIEMGKNKVVLNKPVQVGFGILDLSKTVMYDFHYNSIKQKYGEKARLLFTDTDSLCYEIETEDFYDDMIRDRHLYDLSEFPKDHKCFNETNKKVPGKFKPEKAAYVIDEFVGLRAKLYSLKLWDPKKKAYSDEKRAKGTQKCVKDTVITHADYKECLFSGMNRADENKSIRSFKHQVFSLSLTKTSLSAVNDKKYILPDLKALSYGHYAIPTQ